MEKEKIAILIVAIVLVLTLIVTFKNDELYKPYVESVTTFHHRLEDKDIEYEYELKMPQIKGNGSEINLFNSQIFELYTKAIEDTKDIGTNTDYFKDKISYKIIESGNYLYFVFYNKNSEGVFARVLYYDKVNAKILSKDDYFKIREFDENTLKDKFFSVPDEYVEGFAYQNDKGEDIYITVYKNKVNERFEFQESKM